MLYIIMSLITMFIFSVIIFVSANKYDYKSDEIMLMLLTAIIPSLIWYITIPAIIIIGCAWLFAKLITMVRK